MILSGLSKEDLNEKLNYNNLDIKRDGSFRISNPKKKQKKKYC